MCATRGLQGPIFCLGARVAYSTALIHDWVTLNVTGCASHSRNLIPWSSRQGPEMAASKPLQEVTTSAQGSHPNMSKSNGWNCQQVLRDMHMVQLTCPTCQFGRNTEQPLRRCAILHLHQEASSWDPSARGGGGGAIQALRRLPELGPNGGSGPARVAAAATPHGGSIAHNTEAA